MVFGILFACTAREPYVAPENADTDWIQDISVETVDEMPSALRVRFSSTISGIGWVEFGGDGAELRASPLGKGGTEHDALVLGMEPLSHVFVRAVVEADGQRHESLLFTAETGQLPVSVPQLDVTVNTFPPDDPRALLLSMYVQDGDDVVMMTNLDGGAFWATRQAAGEAFGLGVQPLDGGVAYNWMRDEPDGTVTSEVVQVDRWGQAVDEISTPNAHHYFSRVGEHTYWMTSRTQQIGGVGAVIGDQIMRTNAQGTETVLDLFDVIEVVSDSPDEVIDWSHGNWVTYDAQRGTLLTSAAHLNTIIEFTPDGDVIDVITGLGGAYRFEPQDSGFQYQHGVHWARNGDLLMFAADEHGHVQALRYEVDRDAQVLRRVWAHGADMERPPGLLGELKELSDGSLLVNWGSHGLLQILSPDGALLWEAYTEFLAVPGQAHVLPSPY